MLENIYDVISEVSKKAKLITDIPERFPKVFEDQIGKAYQSSGNPVKFLVGAVQHKDAKDSIYYSANQEYYLAAVAMPLVHTFCAYQEALMKHFHSVNVDPQNSQEKAFGRLRDQSEDALDVETTGNQAVFETLKALSEDGYTEDDIKVLKKFILNIAPLGAGKGIVRLDSYVSSLYKTLRVSQSNSSIHNITGFYLKNPESERLAIQMVDDYLESKQYEAASSLEQVGEYNRILAGAPGTGKSYQLAQEVKAVIPSEADRDKLVFRQTLYPEYSYSDFVGQVMPVKRGDDITYEFSPNIFTNALKRAFEVLSSGQNVFLILEELSRANAAAVFGDLFQLLDRDDGKSEYDINNDYIAEEIFGESGRKVYLPDNFYIWCTVNTSDQNVFPMDTAFKRRFSWQYVSTSPVKNPNINNPDITLPRIGTVKWADFYTALNQVITQDLGLNEDKQIGQFFLKFEKTDSASVTLQLKNKLLQYLWDDVNSVALNGKRIFKDDYLDFSSLYNDLSAKEIFSDAVYKHFSVKESD
jgi:hypothetical protein